MSHPTPSLAIATGNPAKAAALKRVVAACGVRCAERVDVAVDERGPELLDNAREKAVAASRLRPAALAIGSDGGLVLPGLGARWDPLFTSRFASGGPREKARALIVLMDGLHGDARLGWWSEAVAVSTGGVVLAAWTARGPSARIVSQLPARIGPMWVDALIERGAPGADHWDILQERFAQWWQR